MLMCLSACALFPNKQLASLFSISMWKFLSTQLMGQGLITGPWWSSGYDSSLSMQQPDSSLWPGSKILHQATAGGGHLRSTYQTFVYQVFTLFLVLWYCDFHSVCFLMDEDKRLVVSLSFEKPDPHHLCFTQVFKPQLPDLLESHGFVGCL